MYILIDKDKVAWDLFEEREDCFIYEDICNVKGRSIQIIKATDEIIFCNCEPRLIDSWVIDEVCTTIPILINI